MSLDAGGTKFALIVFYDKLSQTLIALYLKKNIRGSYNVNAVPGGADVRLQSVYEAALRKG